MIQIEKYLYIWDCGACTNCDDEILKLFPEIKDICSNSTLKKVAEIKKEG